MSLFSKTMLKVGFAAWGVLIVSCSSSKKDFDWQGHRGARGLMPENTISAFLKALEYPVTTLELDVVITADNEVVVSHDPYFSATICSDSLGREISEQEEQLWNIYQLTSKELSLFDCGSRADARFPDRQRFRATKPLLTDVFAEVASFCKKNEIKEPHYNIELKSFAKGDHIFHPEPAVFCQLVYEAIEGVIRNDQLTIQSFDFRILQYFNENYPDVTLSVLIENEADLDENLTKLGFDPQIYSSHYPSLSREQIDRLHAKGIKVIPWTVNEVADMQSLIQMGVDGIITDYPDRIGEVSF